MTASAPKAIPTGQLECMVWEYESQPLAALSHHFAVRTNDRRLGGRLSVLLSALVAPKEPATWYSLVNRCSSSGAVWALYYGSECVALSPDAPGAVSWLLHHANRCAIESCTGEVVIHAAAAEHKGRALLFPGPPGSGKSTLVAALVHAGLGYLTDEAAALHFDPLHVRPYPKPISVKPGSQPCLRDLEPAAWLGGRFDGGSEWWVLAAAIRVGSLSAAAPPSFVIAPRYQAGAPTSLIAMRPAEAVMVLAENSFNLVVQGGPGLALLARVAERSTSYRLVIGDLQAACRLVVRLLGGPEAQRPAAPSSAGRAAAP